MRTMRTEAKMKRIEATAPTRVDLAGGTLDIWPLYLFHQGPTTLNVAIDIRTRAVIEPRKDSRIQLTSEDTLKELDYRDYDDLMSDSSGELSLLKEHIKHWLKPTKKGKPKGFHLFTNSDSPVGGGIAASSSLNIALCGAFSAFLGKKNNAEKLIPLAGNLEARVLRTPTGIQDYYPAFFGGLNVIRLEAAGPTREVVKFNASKFSERFILVYTGRPHISGLNNWQIMKDHIDGNRHTYQCFEDLRDVARDMYDLCRKQDWDRAPTLFEREFQARVALSPVFSSTEIERLHGLALKWGARAIKICGAGGGGCVFLWTEPKQRNHVEEECRKAGFRVLQAHPTLQGLRVKTS